MRCIGSSDADGELLYVGITNNPRGRMMDHVRSKGWASRIGYITFEHLESRVELVAAERKALATERPTFNVAHNRGEATEGDWEIVEYGPGIPYTDAERSGLRAAAELMGELLK